MEKNYLIQLTNNLYRLTLLFPKKEPLRYKMRELADDILAALIKNSSKTHYSTSGVEYLKLIEVLDSFFEVAKAQNWVSPKDILEIQKEYSKIREQKEYSKIREGLKKLEKVEKVEKLEKVEDSKLIGDRLLTTSARQEKILSFLKEKGRAQVWEIKKIFPEVTKRTLRRDCRQLLKQGLIEKRGERNQTFYQIKG